MVIVKLTTTPPCRLSFYYCPMPCPLSTYLNYSYPSLHFPFFIISLINFTKPKEKKRKRIEIILSHACAWTIFFFAVYMNIYVEVYNKLVSKWLCVTGPVIVQGRAAEVDGEQGS